jgi:peptidoglycan/LPS O-acetylase OafA/YrhL
MPSPPFHHVSWQRQSQLDGSSAHALLISLLRGLAALQVAAAHLRSEIFPGMRELGAPPPAYQQLAFITGFAHLAVVVFFLISGWLVGGSLLNKYASAAPAPLQGYAIDRVTRLWTVLIPAMLTMLVIGAIVGAIDPARPDASLANVYSSTVFLGNLTGLQTILVGNFAGNYALWSLANETWYYVAFPLLLLAFLPGSRMRQAAAVTGLLALAGALPFPITLYFSLWLLGAVFSRIRVECRPGMRIALAATVLLAAACFRIWGNNDDLNEASFLQDLLISLPLLVLLASLQFPVALDSPAKRGIVRSANWLSECSFTLYVTHIPFIGLLRFLGTQTVGRNRLDPRAPLDMVTYFVLLAALLVMAYGSYRLFESHTFRVRRLLKSTLQRRTHQLALAPTRYK